MAGTKESDGLYLMALFWALKNERSPKVYRALVHDTLIERGAWRISSVRMGLTGVCTIGMPCRTYYWPLMRCRMGSALIGSSAVCRSVVLRTPSGPTDCVIS